MAGSDPSRFDYLFEPVDVDLEDTAYVNVQVAPVRSVRTPLGLAAAVVLGAGLGAGLLSPNSADAVETPGKVVTTAPAAPSARPVTGRADTEPAEPQPTPEPVTTADRPPVAPRDAPTTSAPARSAPPSTRAPTPTVRMPISVSPQPRPAFPNQKPGHGSDDRGLLGGLL